MSTRGTPASSDDAAFDRLTTLLVVVDSHGRCRHVNMAFELSVGLSRRSLVGQEVALWFVEVDAMRRLLAVVAGEVGTGTRFEAHLRRHPVVPPVLGAATEALPVLAVATHDDERDEVLLELTELARHDRLDREERVLDQAQVNRELVRNLAHEIKNPLGGIRGAAQLLQLELPNRGLEEYTQVIIHEADRLQALVDRLLAPHRQPHIEGPLNIHEVLERVRTLIAAEHPQRLNVVRDYDTSIPEFRGDREQLIQAVLNIARNACQALAAQMAAGVPARIILRTRVARQVTIAKRRWRLALDLHIEDNGPGVPAELMERIFLPLVSGRDDGHGLGLTLAMSFVQQHGGTIDCESEPGRTIFKLAIPLH